MVLDRQFWRLAAIGLLVACGRDKTVPDDQLGGLVTAAAPPAPIDVDQAAKDPDELSRALTLPHGAVVAALGPHSLLIDTRTVIEEGGKQVEDLADHAQLDLGTGDTFHGVYTNNADYGREAIYTGGKLYLRPRYQRWNGRAPETKTEAAQIRDSYFGAIAATWDLVAPGAELTDRGPAQVAGRAGRKIAIKLAPSPRDNPHETLTQRHWRETRTIQALEGEVTLDADKGVPLAIKLTGSIAFTRDGRRFVMKVGCEGGIVKIGATEIAAPPEGEVVATPTRSSEVDERDYLLHGLAPPIHKTKDGTAREAVLPKAGSGSGK
jgi:hypothetical protein